MFKNEIDGTNYKAIRRDAGLSPAEYNDLERKLTKRDLDKLYVRHQVRIYGCTCKSVWCKKCAIHSPTNDRIRTALSALDWRKVRHIILTTDRKRPPYDQFAAIRRRKAIPKLMSALNCRKWVWVLEFHADAYPHWHILAESSTGHMFKKSQIARHWRYGLVWESYIRNERHWRAIIGYHKSKGYLAGEHKAHQLVLPEYLMSQTTVRKFGRNMVSRGTQSDPANPAKPAKKAKKPAKLANKPYSTRFTECDKSTTVNLDNDRWTAVEGSLSETRELFTNELDRLDYQTFNITSTQVYDSFLDYMRAFRINKHNKLHDPPKPSPADK